MSATNLAQHEEYLKSLENCLDKMADQYKDARYYSRIAYDFLRKTTQCIKHCEPDIILLKALVDELRLTRLDFEEEMA